MGFESLILDFRHLGGVFLAGGGNIDLATLLGIFGAPGVYEVFARVTDLAGLFDESSFFVDVGDTGAGPGPTPIPEPGSELLFPLGLLLTGAAVRRGRATERRRGRILAS